MSEQNQFTETAVNALVNAMKIANDRNSEKDRLEVYKIEAVVNALLAVSEGLKEVYQSIDYKTIDT